MQRPIFRVESLQHLLPTSAEREVTVYRTWLPLRIWDGRQFGPKVATLWDTGADFVTVSEAFAEDRGIDLSDATEQLGSTGTAGSLGGVLVPFAFRSSFLRDVAFRVECQVLLGSDFPRPLLGNRFVRRNFDVETVGERRTYFRLRSPAPDAVPVGRLRKP